MRRIIAFLLTLFMIMGVLSFSACKKDKNQFNIADTSVKNFSTFSSFGVAEKSESLVLYNDKKTSSMRTVYADAFNYRLVGITEDEDCCEISFIDEEGKETLQTWFLYDMCSFGRFVFVRFSNDGGYDTYNNFQGSDPFYISSCEGKVSFLIYQKKGKV